MTPESKAQGDDWKLVLYFKQTPTSSQRPGIRPGSMSLEADTFYCQGLLYGNRVIYSTAKALTISESPVLLTGQICWFASQTQAADDCVVLQQASTHTYSILEPLLESLSPVPY